LIATQTALRFQLLRGERVVGQGGFYRLGMHDTYFEITTGEEPYSEAVHLHTHREALRSLIDHLHRNSHLTALREIDTVVHRMAHGGSHFTQSIIASRDDLHRLQACAHLSPDMPACLTTLQAALSQLPALQICAFDTAFTSTLPAIASEYAVPRGFARNFGLRRWGAQGLLHEGAYTEALLHLRKKPQRVVSVIIDDIVSVVAIREGVVVESSTGFTSAEGLPGLHRTGSLDPRIPLYIAAHEELSPQQSDKLLSQHCGIAAMTERASYAEILQGAKEKDVACADALMMLCYRIAQTVAGMSAALGSIDALVFSGEGAFFQIIEEICRRLPVFGVRLAKRSGAVLSSPHSAVGVVKVEVSEFEQLQRIKKSVLER
jgi:acetate kinase